MTKLAQTGMKHLMFDTEVGKEKDNIKDPFYIITQSDSGEFLCIFFWAGGKRIGFSTHSTWREFSSLPGVSENHRVLKIEPSHCGCKVCTSIL